MNIITFFIPGEPQAQGRPRTRVVHFGRRRAYAQIYNPHNADEWKARIAIYGNRHSPEKIKEGPVRLIATFFLARPNSHFRETKKEGRVLRPDAPMWHFIKPDGDNYLKALKDALTGILWRDDAQVCDERVQKIYTNDGDPGCLLTIQPINLEPDHIKCHAIPTEAAKTMDSK